MARISTYQIDPVISDLDLLIGTDKDNPGLITKNFTLSGIAEYVIDKLIDPDATDFHIPVFRANGTRITDSIMTQNAYPTGSLISVLGSFSVCCGSTLYGNNVLGADSSQITTVNSQLKVLGPVYDSTNTIGSSEQVLVSNEDGELVWENYQGTGLEYQSTWDAAANTPDLTAITLDGTNTGKYWVVNVEGTTDLGGVTDWKVGDWAIISQDNDDNVFWEKIDNSSVDGVGTTNYISKWTGPKALGDSLLEQLPYSITHKVGTHNTELGTYPANDETTGTILNASFLQGCTNHEVPLQFSTTKNVFPEGNVSLVRMTILGDNGYVGIGKNDPAYRLDVNGDIKLDGGLRNVAGSAGTSGQVLASGGSGSSFTWVNQVQLPASNVTGEGEVSYPAFFTGDHTISGISFADAQTKSGYVPGILTAFTNLGNPTRPGIVPTNVNWQFYDGGGNQQGDGGINQQGTMTIGQTGFGNGGRLVINQSGFAGSTNHRLNVGGNARIEGRVNITAGGLCVSNNPSGISLDNTSMVIGSGDNDIISGSDHSMIVGKANQLTKSASGTGSDQSAAIGSANVLIDATNSLAVGQSNVINGTNVPGTNSVRSQVLGYDNSLTGSYSSFIAGGNNTVTTSNNAFALGYSHTLQGIDSQFAFGENCNGPASGQNTFMIGSALTGSDKSMVVGFRNDTSSYPAIDYPNGLGETKFVVGVGSNSNSNAIIITEGGVNRGNPNVEQIPRIILPQQETLEFTSDADATAGGIPTGGLYRNGNDLKINFNDTASGGNEGLAYLTPQLIAGSGPMGGAGFSANVNPNYNLVLLSWSGPNGIFTLNLPLASANTHRLIRITTDGSLDAGAADKINITATGGETIDGAASFQISKRYEGLAVFSTGTEWLIIQAKAH